MGSIDQSTLFFTNAGSTMSLFTPDSNTAGTTSLGLVGASLWFGTQKREEIEVEEKQDDGTTKKVTKEIKRFAPERTAATVSLGASTVGTATLSPSSVQGGLLGDEYTAQQQAAQITIEQQADVNEVRDLDEYLASLSDEQQEQLLAMTNEAIEEQSVEKPAVLRR